MHGKKTRDKWLRIVGENIRKERRCAGLTQEKLAERADLAPRVVQKIEAGDITILISTLRRIRKALDCDYNQLLAE